MKKLLVLLILFGAVAHAQPVLNILEVPTFTHFSCQNGNEVRVITAVDRGVYSFRFTNRIALIEGTLQYTPNSDMGAIFDYGTPVTRPIQLGTFQFRDGVLFMNFPPGSSQCFADWTFDVTDL